MAGDPGVEYPRETIEGSDFEINSLIRLFIRQLKTDSSQFGQIFSQTNFWSKYSSFFFISLKMFIDSDRQVFELRLLILKRKSTCTSGCDRFTTKSKSQRNSNFGMKTRKTKKNRWNGNKNANLKCSEHKDSRRKSLRWNSLNRSFEERATRLG